MYIDFPVLFILSLRICRSQPYGQSRTILTLPSTEDDFVRCSGLAWNPEVPTQVMVAYNDDNNPSLQLWDLRNSSYPFKEHAGEINEDIHTM